MRPVDIGGAILLGLAGSVLSAPHKPRAPQYIVNKQRADAVKQAFRISWDGYYNFAFPHDSLRPVENGYADDRCVSIGSHVAFCKLGFGIRADGRRLEGTAGERVLSTP